MTGSQYKNVIKRTLRSPIDKQRGTTNTAKAIFNNCGVAFPHGDCREVLQKLMTDDYMVWRSCTYKQAQECANVGIATVGVNSDHVVVIEPENDAVYVEDTADGYADNDGFADTVDSIDIEDRMDMQFFAYTLSPVSIMPMAARATTTSTTSIGGASSGTSGGSSGTTTTTTNVTVTTPVVGGGTTVTPKNTVNVDGFAGWYYPSSTNKGIVREIPRFVQTDLGPCLAYSMMMADYYLNKDKRSPETFFKEEYRNYYNGQASKAIIPKKYSQDEMKKQLDAGKPVIVSGKDSNGTPHYVIVVAYSGDGSNKNNYLTIDPWYTNKFVTTYEKFKDTYKNTLIAGDGTEDPMYTY